MEASRLGVTLLRWSWLIVLCGAIAAAVAFGISMQLPEEYESESTLLVGSLTETGPSEQLGYQQLAGTYASLAETPLVLTTVADKLGLDTDLSRLREQVDAQHAEGQALIRIVATAPTAAEAAALAESVGETLSDLSVTPGLDTVPLATVVEEAALSEGPSAPSVRPERADRRRARCPCQAS